MDTNPTQSLLVRACIAALIAGPHAAARAGDNDNPPTLVAQTVFVTATRGALPQAEVPAATSVVRQRELEDRGADNVVDGLRGETGVSAIGRPLGGRRVLSLRGMESRHTLMLIDGQRLAPSDGVIGNSDFQLDWISIGDIDRIEVVRGPMSVLYGSEALGGVINLITRRPGEVLEGRARVEGLVAHGDRGGDGHRATARVNLPLGDAWALAVGASDLRRQAVASKADPRIDELEGRHRTDGSAQLLWRAAQGQSLLLEHREGQEDRWGGARERSGQRRYHLSLHDIERRHTALTWDADWRGGSGSGNVSDNGITTQLRAYSSMLDHHNARTEGVTPLRPNRVDETVIDGHAAMTAGAHRVTGGFEQREEGLRNAALSGGEGSVDHRAAYVQDEWNLGALGLTLGARHDRHEVFGGRTSPRAYGVWKLGQGWIVKGGIGWGYKAPTLKQVTAGYVEDEGPFSYAANPALEPEINRAIEAGFAFQGSTFGAQVMAFHNRVRNLMVPVLVASTPRPLYEWRNVDVAILKGVETSLDWRVMRGVSAKLNHQWLDARNDRDERLDRRPKHVVGAALEWTRADAAGRAPSPVPQRAGLRADHQRGLLLASSTPGAPPQAVPAFTLVSAYAAWSLANKLELGAGIDNLGNLNLVEKSPLYVQGIAPRTFRLSLNARW